MSATGVHRVSRSDCSHSTSWSWPVAGILYLGVYEARLLDAQERAMVQQARLIAAAIGGSPSLDGPPAQATPSRLGLRSDARLRVFDRSGALIADSARVAELQQEDELAGRKYAPPSGVRTRALYRLGALLAGMRERMSAVVRSAPHPKRDSAPVDRPGTLDLELKAALAGRYGAATGPPGANARSRCSPPCRFVTRVPRQARSWCHSPHSGSAGAGTTSACGCFKSSSARSPPRRS